MKVVSFFSGAGGMDLGFIFAGHTIVWSNDFDSSAIQTYHHNIGKYQPHVSINSDIVSYLNRDADEIDKIIPDADMIIGGFPCQGFSIANLNRSMEDSRNFLYEQLLKAISVKKPDYFILENVKGLENMEKGKILHMILKDLEKCGSNESKYFPSEFSGYTVVYNVVNALNFGVAQNRERVIILGIKNTKYNNTNLRKFISINGEGSKITSKWKRLDIPVTHSLKGKGSNPINPIELVNRKYDEFIRNDGSLDIDMFSYPAQEYTYNNLSDVIGDLPLELSDSVNNHSGSSCKVNIKNTMGNRETLWDKYAPTIMGRGSGTGGPLIPPHPEKHRRLSVRETARIQTFPDNFVFQGSNSAAYRQIGNAVPVLLAYNIAKIFNCT